MLFCWLGLPLPVVLGMVQPLEKETFIFCCFEVPFAFVGLNFEVFLTLRYVLLLCSELTHDSHKILLLILLGLI